MQRNSESMERLFTLIMTGGYGAIMVWMFFANKMGWTRGERTLIMLVTPWIQVMVLLGGVLLLALFFILLFNFKRAVHAHHHHGDEDDCCGHDHGHDHHHDHHHDHKHEHDHADQHDCCDHGHGHDHGWNPIRYIPLLLPMVLYFMGLPSDQMIRNFERNLTEKALKGMAKYDPKTEEFKPLINWLVMTPATSLVGPDLLSVGMAIQTASDEIDEDAKGVTPIVTDLAQLEKVVQDPTRMAEFQRYRKIEVDGMFSPEEMVGNTLIFRLVRLRMACCLSDARPATLMCGTKKPLDPRLKSTGSETKWARVQGKIKFARMADGKFAGFVKATSVDWAPMPPFPYLN